MEPCPPCARVRVETLNPINPKPRQTSFESLGLTPRDAETAVKALDVDGNGCVEFSERSWFSISRSEYLIALMASRQSRLMITRIEYGIPRNTN